MELDQFIKFAEQRRRESQKEINAQPRPLTVITPNISLKVGLSEIVALMRTDGESFVQEMRFQMQPKAVRDLVEEEPYVDLQKIERTREGTVAIHHTDERVAAMVSAANPGAELQKVRAVAQFVNGFHFEPIIDIND